MTQAGRFIAAYVEGWVSVPPDGDDGRRIRLEEAVAAGIRVFQLVSTLEANWQADVIAGRRPYSEEEDRQFGQFYREWVEASERHAAEIAELEAHGREVREADEFSATLEEARAIMELRDLDWAIRPIAEILPLARGNPRPEQYGL